MTELAVLPSAAPVKALSHDQMLHYADPFYDMRSGKFQWSLFWNMLGLFALGPFVSIFLLFGIGPFLMTIAGLGLAHRMARLEGTAVAVEATRQHAIKFFYTHFAIVIGLKLGVAVLGGVDGIGGLLIAAYWLFSLYAAGRIAFHFRRAKLWEKPRADHGKAAAPAASLEALRAQRAVILSNLEEMTRFEVFDASDPVLADAWTRKQTGILESTMKDGDALTRRSWQLAYGIYNHAVATVDMARRSTSDVLQRAEAVLARLGITPAPVEEASVQLAQDVGFAEVKRGFTQKLNYMGGFNQVAAKVGTGQMPWQAAVAAAAFTLIMTAINESKLLRQLKELEGDLTLRAQTAKSDMQWTDTLIRTRLLPQFDGLVQTIEALDQALADPSFADGASSDEARRQALQLAMLVTEGKQLLKQTAGS
ncbi:MAG: hypothetical protein KAY22_03090 [Rhizorhabdus sp.]|uniref:hypothetical protein n=1 Tax=Rhizorhabdus sp. TaxID=1968843 RepID=UPI001B765699|nr:hypothetical protein [Rhizorhabdus sp.]MBP8231267.1 hypothetical protein [Rhizorhabdus sp.]